MYYTINDFNNTLIIRDLYGRTPLHWASVAKNTKCLLVLLNYAR